MKNKILELFKNNKKYYEEFMTVAINNSNCIEGSKMSYNQTYDVLFNVKTNQKVGIRDIQETINHYEAYEYLFSLIENKIPLGSKELVTINKIINKKILFIGGYRLGNIRIKGSNNKFPHPLEVEDLINKFLKTYNEKLDNDSIELSDIAQMHMDFLHIHPFQDGNGRTGRMLINYYLIKNNNIPLNISKDKKLEYFNLMENSNIDGLIKMLDKYQKKEGELLKNNGYKE